MLTIETLFCDLQLIHIRNYEMLFTNATSQEEFDNRDQAHREIYTVLVQYSNSFPLKIVNAEFYVYSVYHAAEQCIGTAYPNTWNDLEQFVFDTLQRR